MVNVESVFDLKMSIKSQKSLYDECSEIVEKSYSVKSDDESVSW